MHTNRIAIIIYFNNEKIIQNIKPLDINISFVSKKLKALIAYCEDNYYPVVLKILKKNKFFVKLEKSDLFIDQNLNFDKSRTNDDVSNLLESQKVDLENCIEDEN